MPSVRRTVRRISYCLAALLCVFALVGTVHASTVVPMTVETLADHAGQVIVGTVSSVRSYWADNPRRIESEVTFGQVEYLKGALPDARDEFTLIVPGGTVGEMSLAVCCAPQFNVKEKWLLFLLPSYKTFPVVGLYQGSFIVQADADGIERVSHRRHDVLEPVTGVGTEGFVQYSVNHDSSVHDHLQAAHSLRLKEGSASTPATPALTYAEFVDLLRPILAASRDHELTQPAGQRVLLEYTRAVPLRPSAWQQQHGTAPSNTGESGPVRATADGPPQEKTPGVQRTSNSGEEVQR